MNQDIRVLLIGEDEEDFAAAREQLTDSPQEGYVVTWVRSRAEGVRELQESEFDVCLFDWTRAGSGEVEALVRGINGRSARMPLILLARNPDTEAYREAIRAGAAEILQKDELRFSQFSRTIRNLLERTRIESELRQSERRLNMLSTAVEAAADAVVVTGTEGEILWVNPAFSEMTGYDRQEVIGKTTRILKSGKTPAKVYRDLWETILGGRTWRGDVTNRRKDGSLYVESQSITPVMEAGRITGFISIKRDVTRSRENRMKIAEQANLLNQVRDAIYTRSLTDEILFWNKGAEVLFGYTSAEAVGASALELLFWDSDQISHARQTLTETGEWSGELRMRHRDGRSLTVSSRWRLVRDDEGEANCILAIETDITEQKELEAQFLRAQRLEGIGTLASGVAHDLNNILSPILMGADLLLDRSRDGADSHIVKSIQDSAKRGSAIVQQVLAFARGVEGRRDAIQVKHLAKEVIQICKETFPKNLEIGLEYPLDLLPVMADPTQLHQVMLNLCVNARDAMPHGGKLTLLLAQTQIDETFAVTMPEAKPGDFITISVEDTGHGIPSDIRPKIFDPFFTTKEVGKGTGLGLATVFGIVKNHGGFLTLKSEIGHGTRFTVYLPAAVDGAGFPEKRMGTPRLAGNGETVLVIDDEPAILGVISTTLESAGYRVISAENGADGVARLVRDLDDISVVLADYQVPVMDGCAFMRVARKLKPDLPVLLMSGHSRSDIPIPRDLESDIVYLPKPFSLDQILEKIAVALRKPVA